METEPCRKHDGHTEGECKNVREEVGYEDAPASKSMKYLWIIAPSDIHNWNPAQMWNWLECDLEKIVWEFNLSEN